MSRENTIGETGAPSESRLLGEHNGPEHITLPSDRVLKAALFIDEMIDHLPQIKQRARETLVFGAITVLGILGQIHPEPAVAESASGRRHIPIESLDTHTVAPAMAGSPPPLSSGPEPSATPTNPNTIIISLPWVGKGANIRQQPAPTETKTPPPPPTEKEPTITPTNQITPTRTVAPPTETPTPTEIPLSERLPLPYGVSIDTPGGPSSADSYSFLNGDRDSGAAALGLNFDHLQNPRRLGDYIIGTIHIEGDDPGTIHTTEQGYDLLVSVSKDELIAKGALTQDDVEKIPVFDASEAGAKQPSYALDLWNGSNGEIFKFVSNGANDGVGMLNGSFIADFNKQDAEVNLKGFATSGSGKSGYVFISSVDTTHRQFVNDFVMEHDAGKNQWIIRTVQIDTTFATDLSGGGSSTDQETDEKHRQALMDAVSAAGGWGNEVYRFPVGVQDISFKLSGNAIEVDGKSIPLPYGPAIGLNHEVRFSGDGGRRPDSTLNIQSMNIRFDHLDGAPLREIPETLLPSLADLAEKSGLMTLSPVVGSGLESQPGMAGLIEHTGRVIITNDPGVDNIEDNNAFFKDRGQPVAQLLKTYDQDADIINQINVTPHGVFLLSTTGTANGPINPWFDAKGNLTVSEGKLYKIAMAVQQTGGTLIVDTGVPLKLIGSQPESPIPTPMDNVKAVIRKLTSQIAQPSLNIVFTFSGNQEAYDGLGTEDPTNQIADALGKVKELGVGTGLMHVQGGADWFGHVAKALIASHSSAVGFEFEVRRGAGTLGIYKYEQMRGSDPHDAWRSYRYSAGYDQFRNALVEHLLTQ